MPYAIRGAIWYQGESNASRAFQYRSLFPAMIRSWREAWGQGDFPFYFTQLANFRVEHPEHWAELREAQLLALRTPNTGMAVTIDIGNSRDIHPRNKHDVGVRLALWALAETYGRDRVYSGPLYERVSREGDALRVHFTHTADGLRTADGGALRGFEIASENGDFIDAAAEIDGDSVLVRSEHIPEPTHVRYAFTDDPDANLGNSAGLPASPFRSDDRPAATADAR